MSATLELRQQSPAAVCHQEYSSGCHNYLTFVFHIISLFNSLQYIVQGQSERQ